MVCCAVPKKKPSFIIKRQYTLPCQKHKDDDERTRGSHNYRLVHPAVTLTSSTTATWRFIAAWVDSPSFRVEFLRRNLVKISDSRPQCTFDPLLVGGKKSFTPNLFFFPQLCVCATTECPAGITSLVCVCGCIALNQCQKSNSNNVTHIK
jgi:hypothetical protein